MKHNKLFTICICIVATLFCNTLPSMANTAAYDPNFGAGTISGPKELGEFCVAYYHDGKLYNELDPKWGIPKYYLDEQEEAFDSIALEQDTLPYSDTLNDYESDDTTSEYKEEFFPEENELTDSAIIAMAKVFHFENCSQNQKFHLFHDVHSFCNFKFIVHYPNTDYYYISPSVDTKHYIHHTISLDEGGMSTQEKDYTFTMTVILIILAMLITVGLELGMGWAFSYRSRKDLLTIAITNTITNLLMNILICPSFLHGNDFDRIFGMAFVIVILEPLVWIIESIVYLYTLERKGEHYILRTVGFALAANVVSFAIGLVIISFIKDLIVSLFGF